MVHSGLMGPSKPMSAGGNNFLPAAVDDFSGYAPVRPLVRPLKHKCEAPTELKRIVTAWVLHDRRVKTVSTDRNKECAAFNR
jgi:hypothetical protein